MPVNVNTQVQMSCFSHVPTASSIGTDGLATCVGVIVIYPNRVFCGHMASNAVIPNRLDPAYAAGVQEAQNLLNQTLQNLNLGNIQAAHICSGQADFSSQAITEGFQAALRNNDPQLHAGSCFYYLNANVVAGNDTLVGQAQVNVPGDWDI